MNKIALIIQREYLSRVKKRSFLLTTILVPIIIIGFYAAIIAISISGSSDTQRVAIIDEANLFGGTAMGDKDDKTSYTFISNEQEQQFKEKYKDLGYTSFLYVPKTDITNPKGIKLHSPSAVSLTAKSKIESMVNKAIESRRLSSAHRTCRCRVP